MTAIPGFYTTAEAAAALGVSRQRVSAIAKRQGWQRRQVGRSVSYLAADVEGAARIRQYQRAWAALGITRNLWGKEWLRGGIMIGECSDCGNETFCPGKGPKPYRRWSACPKCGWTRKGD